MTNPAATDAGQPEDNQTADTAAIAALVDRLNIPDRGPRPPRTAYETCPCCQQPTGTYWAVPKGWEPTA
jgi:hypothetical protein